MELHEQIIKEKFIDVSQSYGITESQASEKFKRVLNQVNAKKRQRHVYGSKLYNKEEFGLLKELAGVEETLQILKRLGFEVVKAN